MTDDRTLIVELLGGFASATDGRDWDTIASLLTDDVVAYGARGPAAVVARMQEHLGGVGPTQHLLGNHRVRVDGDQAQSRTYGRVHHVGAGPMAGSFFECLGDYDDHWLRTPTGWRIARRRFDIRISLGDMAVLRPA
ncbi:nuclear transport factor 2 family protein [Nocardioides piscis]|uniref:Nuclear transport factor 2 family protein n=1 Tax=Nocardioides piscis TaxID=2714938 RepID=A0A6G7YHP2_9ACTN|nr:nuclear transport factor 2 family protein [Nocardioides piscis]QIK76151.1 nuclear transport factor 2 family protein [Nocardioides piscis]